MKNNTHAGFRRHGWWISALLLAAALGAGVWARAAWGKKEEGEKPPVPLQFAATEVTRPAPYRLPTLIEFSGALVAPGSAQVRTRAAGTLVRLDVVEGQRVQAGQVIGQIELVDFASREAERRAAIDSARAALAQAERSHAANQGLAAQGFIAGTALDGSKAQVETARAALQSAQAQLATLEAGRSETQLLAPIAGIVARRQVLPGEKVSPDQPVVQIVDLGRLELAGQVAAHEIALLGVGQQVEVRVEGERTPRSGRVTRIAPMVEPGTRSIAVTVELANPGERLRAGQYALAHFERQDSEARLTVPLAAVFNNAGQDQVWTIEAGRLTRRAVTLGRRDARQGRVEILSGLHPHADLLALRFDNLKEGAPATLPGAAAPAGPAASATLPAVSPASSPAATGPARG